MDERGGQCSRACSHFRRSSTNLEGPLSDAAKASSLTIAQGHLGQVLHFAMIFLPIQLATTTATPTTDYPTKRSKDSHCSNTSSNCQLRRHQLGANSVPIPSNAYGTSTRALVQVVRVLWREAMYSSISPPSGNRRADRGAFSKQSYQGYVPNI